MSDLKSLCSALQIDRAAAAAALREAQAASAHDVPWYVLAMLTLGSWITAIVVTLFGVFFLVLVVEAPDESFGTTLASLGVAYFVPAFYTLWRRAEAVFVTHFSTAVAVAGQVMATVGIGMETESSLGAAIVAPPFAVLVAALLENRIAQTLASAVAVIVVLLAIYEHEAPFLLEATAIGLGLGVALHVWPTRRDLMPTATVLLLAAPVLSILFSFRLELGLSDTATFNGWGARAIYAALMLGLLAFLWRGDKGRQTRTRLVLFAAGAIAVGALLPPGGSAAIVIMVLAYILGARLLALAGVLLQIYFLWQFYYDLDMSLLDKSMLLSAVGVVLLALWAVLARLRPGGHAT